MATLLAKLGAEALRPQFVNGSWRKAAISAKNAARLRKEALLEGRPWVGDEIKPPAAPAKRRKPKGHKHERESVIRQQTIAANMEAMPEKIKEHRLANIVTGNAAAEGQGGHVHPGPADLDAQTAPLEGTPVSSKPARKRPRLSSGGGGGAPSEGAGRAGHGVEQGTACGLAGSQVETADNSRQEVTEAAASTCGGETAPDVEEHRDASGSSDGADGAAAGAFRGNQCTLALKYLRCRSTDWQPASVAATLNIRLDGRIVPSSQGGARVSYSHIAVLDNFIDEPTRAGLLDFLTQPGAGAGESLEGAAAAAADGASATAETDGGDGSGLPSDKWERKTADRAELAPTWGVKEHVLRELACSELGAVQEVHARLCKLYPEVDIAFMPSDLIQQLHVADATADGADGRSPIGHAAADCDQFVANAAVAGDVFAWHIDADPAGFPDSHWTGAYGDYCNGEAGRPLFVSLLLYLNDAWPREWDAETLFLDSASDVGIVIRPKRFRAVLMDQDVLHRLSAPSPAAGGRPRFSLVWKLVFVPRDERQSACIARTEWGAPTSFASAARLDAIRRAMLRTPQGDQQ